MTIEAAHARAGFGRRRRSGWEGGMAGGPAGRELLTVVAYDVADDRRRARLATLLEDYGSCVQYSVFECLLTEHRLGELRRLVEAIVEPPEDRVAYYRLCSRCAPQSPDARRSISKALLL